ncbi:MAG: AAA family ATPase [Candidatus Omnitrophica bacterium]|nr:AAA family ATPase [Candidatus Omnitrophota bacterium]
MYTAFYKLKENPFNVTSDPNFLYMSRRHREAFSFLMYGIENRKGFLEITGEIGTGKTTLCKAILNKFDEKVRTAFIINPDLSELQLLESVAEDFGIELPKRMNKLALFRLINKFLIHQLSLKNNVVLIIDEAQNLKSSLLEQIRLLSNLETEKEKLIQIVLVGQPELRDKLNSPSLAQLRQRIGIRYHITPLEKSEVREYIMHRLHIAGPENQITFLEDAIDEIYKFSEGVPRLINMVCDRALLFGFVLEKHDINVDIVKRGIEEIKGRVYEYHQ